MVSNIPIYKFFNRSIWLKDGALKHTSTLGQSEPGSNGNEGVPYTP